MSERVMRDIDGCDVNDPEHDAAVQADLRLREALAEWDAIEGSDLAAQFRAFLAAGKMADAIRAVLGLGA